MESPGEEVPGHARVAPQTLLDPIFLERTLIYLLQRNWSLKTEF